MNNRPVATLVLIIAFSICILTIGIHAYLCPIFDNVPQPTGNLNVGYTHYAIPTDNLNHQLDTLSIDVFYPTTLPKQAKPAHAYQPHKIKALITEKAKKTLLPHFFWHCMLTHISSHAKFDAPIAPSYKTYPIIIYLPGIAGDDLHNVYLEELASHGYVVCAIAPPGDTLLTILPNGKTIPLDPPFAKAIQNNNREAIYAYRNKAHKKWYRYIHTTIEWLTKQNKNMHSMFYNRLDFNRIGIVGHSHGGAVALDFCQNNNICKAGINMDGWTKTYNKDDHFNTPFLFLLSETGKMPEMQLLFNNNKRPNFHITTITHAGHLAFNDHILIKKPFARFFGITHNNNKAIMHQIKQNIVSFFKQYV